MKMLEVCEKLLASVSQKEMRENYRIKKKIQKLRIAMTKLELGLKKNLQKSKEVT